MNKNKERRSSPVFFCCFISFSFFMGMFWC